MAKVKWLNHGILFKLLLFSPLCAESKQDVFVWRMYILFICAFFSLNWVCVLRPRMSWVGKYDRSESLLVASTQLDGVMDSILWLAEMWANMRVALITKKGLVCLNYHNVCWSKIKKDIKNIRVFALGLLVSHFTNISHCIFSLNCSSFS